MNKLKKNKKHKKQKPDSKFKSAILSVLNGSFLTRDNVLGHLPFVFFLVFVSVCYISYGYYAESTVKEMYKLETEVKDMKSQNLTLKSDLEVLKQQSHVAETIKELGLKESVEPPHKFTTKE